MFPLTGGAGQVQYRWDPSRYRSMPIGQWLMGLLMGLVKRTPPQFLLKTRFLGVKRKSSSGEHHSLRTPVLLPYGTVGVPRITPPYRTPWGGFPTSIAPHTTKRVPIPSNSSYVSALNSYSKKRDYTDELLYHQAQNSTRMLPIVEASCEVPRRPPRGTGFVTGIGHVR